MNRRDFFRGTPAVVAGAAAAAVAVKAAVAESERKVGKMPELAAPYVTEEQVVDFNPRLEHIMGLPSPVVQMIPFRDQLIVACANGDVFALTHDVYHQVYRMHESG